MGTSISSFSTPFPIAIATCIRGPTKCARVLIPTLARTRLSKGSSKRRRPTASTTEVKINEWQIIKAKKKVKRHRRRRGGFCDSSSSPTFHTTTTLYQNKTKKISITDRLSMINPPVRIISLDCHGHAVCICMLSTPCYERKALCPCPVHVHVPP